MKRDTSVRFGKNLSRRLDNPPARTNVVNCSKSKRPMKMRDAPGSRSSGRISDVLPTKRFSVAWACDLPLKTIDTVHRPMFFDVMAVHSIRSRRGCLQLDLRRCRQGCYRPRSESRRGGVVCHPIRKPPRPAAALSPRTRTPLPSRGRRPSGIESASKKFAT